MASVRAAFLAAMLCGTTNVLAAEKYEIVIVNRAFAPTPNHDTQNYMSYIIDRQEDKIFKCSAHFKLGPHDDPYPPSIDCRYIPLKSGIPASDKIQVVGVPAEGRYVQNYVSAFWQLNQNDGTLEFCQAFFSFQMGVESRSCGAKFELGKSLPNNPQ
ncbi:hypothetical protein [Methylobacterium sp. R2-1]|uniref:hypothetical protein n=1 Tax=Methylobacterium sp. R2-1 TaxID=2587064 RepID=UPI00161EC027|nr:hypothetical protein [Methylobacterium sp. R2-1]MBB2963775.1 hypothetical protein [Methylobacterium sp. R2-1]